MYHQEYQEKMERETKERVYQDKISILQSLMSDHYLGEPRETRSLGWMINELKESITLMKTNNQYQWIPSQVIKMILTVIQVADSLGSLIKDPLSINRSHLVLGSILSSLLPLDPLSLEESISEISKIHQECVSLIEGRKEEEEDEKKEEEEKTPHEIIKIPKDQSGEEISCCVIQHRGEDRLIDRVFEFHLHIKSSPLISSLLPVECWFLLRELGFSQDKIQQIDEKLFQDRSTISQCFSSLIEINSVKEIQSKLGLGKQDSSSLLLTLHLIQKRGFLEIPPNMQASLRSNKLGFILMDPQESFNHLISFRLFDEPEEEEEDKKKKKLLHQEIMRNHMTGKQLLMISHEPGCHLNLPDDVLKPLSELLEEEYDCFFSFLHEWWEL